MDLSKEKGCFLNKKGVSLAVFSAIFLGIFLFGIYFYFGSGNLTGETIYENLFGRSELGITGNTVTIQSEPNPSCVGATRNFTCGDTITESCTMNGNIFLDSEIGLPCFEFGNDDLTLDCNGYGIFTNSLEYSNPNPMGIFSFSKKGISIFNCTFSGFVFGAYFHNSSSLNLVGNNFSSNYYGMVLSSSNDGVFKENYFSDSLHNPLSVEIYNSYTLKPLYGYPATFQTQFHTGIGAHIYNSSNNSFFNNSLMGNNKEGFSLILSNNNSFFNNLIFYGGDSGFYLERSEENNFTSNRAGFNQIGFSSWYLNKNNSLFGNTFCSNNYKDIYYEGSSFDFGDENYCNSTFNWNDIGTEGCTSSCEEEQCVNNWVYGDWGECVDYGFDSIREREYYDSNFCFTQSVTPHFNEECNGKCLGKTSSFLCGDFVTESCYFGSDIYSTSFSPNYACFLITSDNVSIDCRGNSLISFGGISQQDVYHGVFSGANNFTLDSCTFLNFPIGISISSNSSIKNSIFSNSSYGGIFVSSSLNKILNNIINNSGVGIYLENNSAENNLSFNTIYNLTSSGIVGENSLNNYLEGNNVYNNSIYDIFVNLSLNNIGIDNACCGFSVWNDSGFEGCTYSTCLEELISPEVKITYPVSNGAYSSISYLFYSTSGADFDRCWYSSNGGETNSSSVLANIGQFYYPSNLGDLTYTFTPTVYCNTTSGEVFNDSIKFLIGKFNSAREVNKLLAFDGTIDDNFGNSVSISGDYAIVGAWVDDSSKGSAYIFKKNSTGQFEQVNKLLASDGAASDIFGYSVSISGDYAIVGAYLDDDKGSNSGSAYIFKKNSTGQFEEINKITASDGAASDIFGYSVSISGDYAIVGAYLDDDKGSNSGSAYIFKKNSTGQFEEINKITASDGAASDYFGYSVSISGDYAIIGAHWDDDKGDASGSAYIFKKNSTGQFEEINKILASDGAVGDYFGSSVSISGDYAIVGAYGDDDKGSFSGSAYIFKKNSTGQFEEINKILASDGAVGDYFGSSVSISGDYAIIGAFWDDSKGSAYIFQKNSTGQFEEVNKLLASDGAASDHFGSSVSISGDDVIVGAYWDDDKGSYSGSAYIYNLYQCTSSLVNTTKSAWTNISCLESNLMNQSRYWIEYDENNCGTFENKTYFEYNVSGESCVYSSCVGATTNFTCGNTITESCTMNGNLTSEGNCFSIFSNNIVVDCAGYSIIGNGGGSAFDLDYSNNSQIKNCVISNFSSGVYLGDSNNNSLLDNTFSNNHYGIYVRPSDFSYNNSILNNFIFNNSFRGIRCHISNNLLIMDNSVFENSGRGIEVIDSNNVSVVNNFIFNNSEAGLSLFFSNNNSVLNNSISNNGNVGINSFFSEGSSFIQNSVFLNSFGGIHLLNSSYGYFNLNYISENFEFGLLFNSSSNNNVLEENTFDNNYVNDIYSEDSFENIGINNICNSSVDWNDEGVAGCTYSCIENWSCTDWSSCVGGFKNRTCTDSNNCLSLLNKPDESQSCSVNRNSPSGGSSSSINTIHLDFTSSFTQRTNRLQKGDKIEFFLKDSSLHNLEFVRISGNRAYFIVRSEPIYFNLSVGEEKYFDLDSNGENDFYVRVENIFSDEVSVLTQSLGKGSPIIDDSSNSNNENNEETPFVSIPNEILSIFDPSKRRIFFISAISILGIGILVVLYFLVSLMIKSNQEKKHSLREEVRKLIEQGNSFVYSGKKGEALSSYEKARKIFEANKEHCGGLFNSLKNLYDSILRMR